MRYLRQQNINRRAPFDQRLYVDMTDSVVMNTQNNLLIPKGTGNSAFIAGTSQNQRPVAPVTGMMRYNTSTDEVEIYQGVTSTGKARWRSLRFKESAKITQQTFIDPGDAVNVLFGPLNPSPDTFAESGTGRYGADFDWDITQIQKQYIVLVENVIQISGTNFKFILNPAQCTGIILSFQQSTKTITSSNILQINFSELKFQIDDTITIVGSDSNDATYTIANVTSNQLTVQETLVDEAQGNSITVAKSPLPVGYYIAFDSAVPVGKYVTVYHGFDR